MLRRGPGNTEHVEAVEKASLLEEAPEFPSCGTSHATEQEIAMEPSRKWWGEDTEGSNLEDKPVPTWRAG